MPRLLLAFALVTTIVRAAVAMEPQLVVFLGDSLSAGFGLPARESFPAVIERALRERGTPIRIVNAGVSGDTTAGGLARLPWLLRQEPDLVIVELGGNDGLRGQPVEAIEKNLRAIVERSLASGAGILLLEMTLPPSYGAEYVRRFTAAYSRVACDLEVPLVEGFLRGVGGVGALNLSDGIHPTAGGHERLAENVIPALTDALARGRSGDSRIASAESERPRWCANLR